MYFIYTIDELAEEPVMLLNKHIGHDDEEGDGILGNQFQAELMKLDTMGKKRIQVFINSVGGSVMDAMSIYSAIIKCNTPVDTYCAGVAASSAALVFQAGRSRIMADYGLLMFHNPYTSADAAEGDESLEKFKGSIVKMICSRSGRSEDEVCEMMNSTTWLTAAEALEAGMCDAIEACGTKAEKMPATGDTKAMWARANTILNKMVNLKSQTDMQKTKRPALPKDGTAKELEAVKNKLQLAELARQHAEQELTEIQNKLSQREEEMEQLRAAKEAAEEEKQELVARSMISHYAQQGRIKKAEEIMNKWVALAMADMEGTKKLLESLPVNKTAVALPQEEAKPEETMPYNMAAVMSQLKTKSNNKIKN